MAESMTEQLRKMFQIQGSEQRQWRRSIETQNGASTVVTPVSAIGGTANLVDDDYRYERSGGNQRPTVRFDEVDTSATYDRPKSASNSNDIWLPCREDGTWYIPARSDGAQPVDAAGPNNSTATRPPRTGGQQMTPGNRQYNTNRSEGGRRWYSCGFPHLRRDCPKARGGWRFVSRMNNSTSGDTDDDRNATSYYLLL